MFVSEGMFDAGVSVDLALVCVRAVDVTIK